MHPASQRRLLIACCTVLGSLARHADLRADVMQEATCRLATRLLAGNLSYSDRGPEQFAGWLLRLWVTSCSDAWQACHPLWLSAVAQSDLEQIAAPPPLASARRYVAELIFACPDPQLRRILADWSSARTIRESARKRGLSRKEIGRLRDRLSEWIRDDRPTP